MIKRNIYFLLFALVNLLVFTSCDDPASEEDEGLVGNWIELSDFEGVARSDAVGFSIGSKGYVGTGYDGSDRLNDFWEYDVERNTWMQKADFPGGPRNGAVGFGTDTKGYIGTGYDGEKKMNDFWEYDPITNSWTQKPDFAGSGRYGAIGISIDNKGYIGTGFDGNYLKDFWQYDPIEEIWNQKVSVGGGKRRDAVAFVIEGKAYICTGIDNGTYENDFWEYDPQTDSWTAKRKISDATDETFDDEYTSIVGISKVAFSIGGRGYVATGGQNTADKVVWEYNPSTDLWEKKTSLEATGRSQAVAFAIGDQAFITTGRNSTYYFDDIWCFEPFSEYNEDD